MLTWWEGLSLLQRIFVTIAVPSTLILLIQSVMVIFGLADDGDGDGDTGGGHDGGFDASDADSGGIDSIIDSLDSVDSADGGSMDVHIAAGHGEHGETVHSSGLSLFTVRGITAFFSVGGWMGLVLTSRNVPPVIAIPVAFLVGTAALFGLAYIFKGVLMLQETGNINVDNAIGKTAQVYLTIPANSKGKGKVTLIVQEKYVEFEACTNSDTPIKTGETVHVTDVLDGNVLVVEQTILNRFPEYTTK